MTLSPEPRAGAHLAHEVHHQLIVPSKVLFIKQIFSKVLMKILRRGNLLSSITSLTYSEARLDLNNCSANERVDNACLANKRKELMTVGKQEFEVKHRLAKTGSAILSST